VTAFRERHDNAEGLVKAVQCALDGGEEGCRELALHARDGYAHPLAYLLLHGVIAPEDNDEDDDGAAATTISTDSFSFDHEDGTNLKRTSLGRETIIVDRNHHGAVVHHRPPSRRRMPRTPWWASTQPVANTSGRSPPAPMSTLAMSTRPLASAVRFSGRS
jgi:hypothetical protein